MSELKLISPMLDDFIVGSAVSEHDGVRCYPAMKNNSDTRYILKVISIPASQVQLDALLLTGAYKTKEAATEYFAQLAQDVQNEVGILTRLSKLEGFLTYEACQVVANEENAGYDVYLLGVYKRSLERHFRKYPMTHLAAVNLGLDMCASLTVCRQAGYLCADLKPGNIFISDDNEYRIGDLGFLPIIGLKYASLPDRYRSAYTAPELSDPFAPISPSMDIYAAGLILYQAYNGGVLPFEGQAPEEPLPAPLYADYEMSEIILKACAPDPADRWEDPIKMGQALVGYMQRNGANDTPIIPPPAQVTEEPEEVPFEEEPAEDEESGVLFEQADEAGQMMIEQMLDFDAVAASEQESGVEEEAQPCENDEAADEIPNLSFLDALNTDETAPQEEMAQQIIYSELTDDACDILAQADDLIAHEAPAPVVAPEPIEVPMPEPIVPEPEEAPAAEEAELPEEASDTQEEDTPDSEIDQTVAQISEAVASTDMPLPQAPVAAPEEAPSEQEEPEELFGSYDEEDKPAKKNIGNRILAGLLVLIILGCLCVAGYIFYRDYYIKIIDDIQLSGTDDKLTVSVSTKVDHDLLTVVCTDTYGNRVTAPVQNGFATFSELNADTLYTVTVEISGFHGVKGDTRATYTTAPQTQIVGLNAVTGAEPGTVILNFSITGHDHEQWSVTYSAQGETPQTVTFTGHMATVTGLTVGTAYTFTVDTAGNGFVTGQTQLEYTPTELVYAENLDVTAFTQEGLTVVWDDPAGTDVAQWTVLCYNDAGESQTIITEENTAKFEGLDPTASYTVEVTAEGMSVGSRFYLSKNAVTASNFQAAANGADLDISWECSGNQPSSEWVLTYALEGSTTETVIPVTGNTGKLEGFAPNVTYTLKLQLTDGTTVIGGLQSFRFDQEASFDGYGATAEGMTWQMCVAPAAADWDWWSVASYQDSFTVGQSAGFVVRLANRYAVSDDLITVVYVVRSEDGAVVSVNSTEQSWTSMWYQYYGEFNLPVLPQTPGNYTVEIYFNGATAHTQAFTVSE